MSKGLDPNQGKHSVSPDLGPNCLYYSKDYQQTTKVPLARKGLKIKSALKSKAIKRT